MHPALPADDEDYSEAAGAAEGVGREWEPRRGDCRFGTFFFVEPQISSWVLVFITQLQNTAVFM
jgi:hypothetical protein